MEGDNTVKHYSLPTTPCDRLMQHDLTGAKLKAALSEHRAGLDPVALLHNIREALVTVTLPELGEAPQGESLEQFLAKLPSLWRQGEARPTHAARVRGSRHWRTRRDPFEEVWLDILLWLRGQPFPVAGAFDDDLVAGVGQPDEGAVAEDGVLEQAQPLVHGPVASDDEAGSPVAVDDQFVQVRGLLGGEAVQAPGRPG